MKKLILMFMMIIAVSSYSKVGVGLGVGSDTEVLVGVHDLNIGVGVGRDLSLRVDKHFAIPDTPQLYWGVGGKISENDHEQLGLRGIGGINFFPEREVEIYAQVVPTFYVLDDVDAEVEYSLGMRYWFD